MDSTDRQDAITTILSATGITYSIQDVKEVISIILLVLSIVNILWVLGSRIYKKIKNKDYESIPEDVDDAIDKLNNLKDGDK